MSSQKKNDHLIERAGLRLDAYSALSGDQSGKPLPMPSTGAGGRSGNGKDEWKSLPQPRQPVPPAPAGDASAISQAAMEKAGLSIAGAKRSRLSEEYQVFSAQVIRRLGEQVGGIHAGGNLLMITSAKAGEGKSFTSINLATALARTRKQKVLLIDGDPKQDSLSVLLGVSDRPGLFDLAQPQVDISSLLLPTFVPDLRILPIGTIVAAHETTHRIVSALDTLSRHLSDTLVMIDAPPCLATSDASSLAARCSHIVMVVEAERTQRAELENALDMVAHCQHISLVLNKMRSGASSGFGAYGYYGS